MRSTSEGIGDNVHMASAPTGGPGGGICLIFRMDQGKFWLDARINLLSRGVVTGCACCIGGMLAREMIGEVARLSTQHNTHMYIAVRSDIRSFQQHVPCAVNRMAPFLISQKLVYLGGWLHITLVSLLLARKMKKHNLIAQCIIIKVPFEVA